MKIVYNGIGVNVYTRTIKSPPKKIIENGRALFGDYNYPPQKLSIQRLKQPFSLMPLPNFITKTRIRSNICFTFTIDDYIGTIEIMDANLFAFGEVNVWKKNSRQCLSYRTIILRRRTIPQTALKGDCKSHRKNRYIRILWDYEKNNILIVCRLKHDKTRPDVHFAFSANLNNNTHIAVIPAPTLRRCAAIHHIALSIEGNISQESSVLTASPFVSNGLGFFTLRRSFYKLRSFVYTVTAQGMLNEKKVQFNIYISNQDPVDSNLYNENILFIDGTPTPLPPVTITHPRGIQNQWIIQDTESMIDLSFLPTLTTVRRNSILILRTQYHTLFGICEGSIKNKDGEDFLLKDFSAVAKKQYLRL